MVAALAYSPRDTVTLAAEAAAAQYLENIRRLSQHLEEAQDPVEWEQLPEEGADGDGET